MKKDQFIKYWIGRCSEESGGESSGLSASLEAKFEFIWIGTFTGDNLKNILGSDVITVTGKDFSTTYIPSTSSATFAVPNNATYLADDGTDDFWFNGANTLLQKTTTTLVAIDPQRTIIKYANGAPHNISWIGILKSGEVLTAADKDELTTVCELYYLYFDEWNDLGYGKENRA